MDILTVVLSYGHIGTLNAKMVLIKDDNISLSSSFGEEMVGRREEAGKK